MSEEACLQTCISVYQHIDAVDWVTNVCVAVTDTVGSLSDVNPEEEYNMSKGRRGLALIFNYQQFDFKLKLNSRFGSEVDCSNMQESLKGLGFDVKVFPDLKTDEVTKELDAAAKADHSDADAFVLVYMSHGEEDYVYTYDGQLKIQDITDKFKGTESLNEKPKIFIWQACRGNEWDQPSDSEVPDGLVMEPASLNTLPAGADFIMCYSVAKGYFSHRDTKRGTWFIQDLCEHLQKSGNSQEFINLLTDVNKKVSDRDGKGKSNNGKPSKQVPCFASMLTKNLYLRL